MHRTPLHELCLQVKLLELGEISPVSPYISPVSPLQIKLLELGEIEDFLAKARAPTHVLGPHLLWATPTTATLTMAAPTRATLTMAMPTRATLTTGHTYYGHT